MFNTINLGFQSQKFGAKEPMKTPYPTRTNTPTSSKNNSPSSSSEDLSSSISSNGTVSNGTKKQKSSVWYHRLVKPEARAYQSSYLERLKTHLPKNSSDSLLDQVQQAENELTLSTRRSFGPEEQRHLLDASMGRLKTVYNSLVNAGKITPNKVK